MKSVIVTYADGEKTPIVKFQGQWMRRDVDRAYKLMLNNLMKHMRTFKILKPKLEVKVSDQITKTKEK